MQVKILTMEQARAIGWMSRADGDLTASWSPPDNWRGTAGIASGIPGLALWGQTVTLTRPIMGLWTPIANTDWDGQHAQICPGLALVGKLKSLTAIRHLDSYTSVGVESAMEPSFGTWIPIHGGVRNNLLHNAHVRAAIGETTYGWARDWFEPSPIVDLVFGTLAVTEAPTEAAQIAPAAPVRKEVKPSGLPEAATRFRDAARIERLGLLTCGFELETQETEGHTWNGIGENESEIDEEAYYEAINSRVRELMGDSGDYMPRDLRDRVRAAIEERVIDSGDVSQSDYSTEANPRDYMENNYRIPRDIEVGEDGSVDGFEFRTKGALTYPRFMKAAEGIFKLDHTIDDGCSFHIHLGVKGVKHSYGARLQMAMVEYLVENIGQVPASVRDRWAGIKDNQYICKLISPESEPEAKYCFVAKHPQGTWEFRCFGNVTNAKDARICLDLAIAAMVFAYQVVSGQATLQADTMPNQKAWHEAAIRALTNGKSLSTTLTESTVSQVAA